MSWVKIDDQLHTHEKHLTISLTAEGLWTRCISWVGDKETDGYVPSAIVRLHAGPMFAELSQELIDAGLWVPSSDGKGFNYHGYLEYNKSHEQLEEERRATAARQGRFRDNKRYKNSNNGVTNSVTNDTVTPAPVPVPVSRTRVMQENTVTHEEESGGVGDGDAVASDRPMPPPSRKKAEVSEDEWLESLRANPAYRHVDIDTERGKCLAWCNANRQQATRKRFVNWLNRIDPPITAPDGAISVRGSPPPRSRADAIADTNRRIVAAAIAAANRTNGGTPPNEVDYHDDFTGNAKSLP